MTELVIRIDPARALHVAYSRARAGVVDGWRYVERTWRIWHDQPVLTRLMLADRRTHLKLAMVAVAVASLLLIYGAASAITATPPRPALKQRLDDAAADTKASVRVIELPKQAAVLDPKPVKTERILPTPAPSVPPVEVVPEEYPTPAPPLPPTRRRYAMVERPVVTRAARGGDVCARVGWRKEITRGGKSWRCRR